MTTLIEVPSPRWILPPTSPGLILPPRRQPIVIPSRRQLRRPGRRIWRPEEEPSLGAITYKQNAYVEQSSPSSPAQTAAFGNANVAGNAIFVLVAGLEGSSGGNPILSVSDSQLNVYTQYGGTYAQTNGTFDVYFGAVYACFAAKGGSGNQISVSYTTTNVLELVVAAVEYSGGINAYDNGTGENSTVGGLTATSTSGSFTTTQVGMILSLSFSDNGAIGPGTNYTSRVITSLFQAIVEDWIGATAGPNDATAPLGGGTQNWGQGAWNFYIQSTANSPVDPIFFGMNF